MKGITYCGACADYDLKKHRCRRGAMQDSNPQDKFFADCPLPTVKPLVHGQWVDAHGDRRVAECSVCKEQFKVTFDGPSSDELFAWFARFYRYCPNCGARMDGAGDG